MVKILTLSIVFVLGYIKTISYSQHLNIAHYICAGVHKDYQLWSTA